MLGRYSAASVAACVGVGLAIAVYLAFQLPRLSVFSYGWDEGFYLQAGWLVAMGYRPHAEIFFSQVPGFAWLLGALYALAGHKVEGFRLAVVLAGAVSLVVVAWLATAAIGRTAGVVSAWLMTLNPKFQDLTRIVEADSLALPFMLLAVSLVVAYRRGKAPRLLTAVLSGLVLGLGTQLKLSAGLGLPLLVGGILQRGRLKDAAACLGAWAFTFGIVLLLSSPGDAVAQFLVFQSRGTATYGVNVAANFGQIVSFLWVDRGLVLLALAGVVIPSRRHFLYAAALGWLGLLGVFYLFKSPLYDHNLVTLIPGLVLLSGLAAQNLASGWGLLEGRRIRRSNVVLAALVTAYIVLIPRLVAMDLITKDDEDAALRAVSFLVGTVPPGSWVVADEPMVAFRAKLPVLPHLADASNYRLATGYLTAAELVAATESFRPSVVISWGRFQQNVPGYVQWLRANYREAWADGQHSIFLLR